MTIRLVAIDPDTIAFGWALLENRLLVATDVAITPYLPEFKGHVHYVCEIPEDRPGTRYRKNDILALALAAGRIVGCRDCTFRTPTQWKGQIPKKVHHERMRGVMSTAELRVLDWALTRVGKGSQPEILDAVALCLTELGRL